MKCDNQKEVELFEICDTRPSDDMSMEIFEPENKKLTVKIESLSAIEERSDEMSIRQYTKDLT